MSGLTAPVYELIAMGLRYWLVFLAVALIWRTVRLMQKDQGLYRKALRHLPDAGLVGELVELDSGKAFPLPREGMIGSGRASDIRLEGVRRRALEIAFRAGYGLKLIPSHRRHGMRLDDELIRPAGDYALHGSILDINGRAYRFRLFEGLDVPDRAAPIEDRMPQAAEAGTEAEEDIWSQQMVMMAPPPLPPEEDGQGLSGPAWPDSAAGYPPGFDGYGAPPQGGISPDDPYWHQQQNWEDRDGY